MSIYRLLLKKYLTSGSTSPLLPSRLSFFSSLIACMAIVLVVGTLSGFQYVIKEKVRHFYPQLSLVNPYGQITDSAKWLQYLAAQPAVSLAEPVLYGEFILASYQTDGSPRSMHGAMIKSVAADRDAFAGTLRQRGFTLQGTPVAVQEVPLILGVELARTLRVAPGDALVMYMPYFRTTLAGVTYRAKQARVAAVIDTGLFRYNSKTGFVPFADLQAFLDINGVLAVDIYLRDARDQAAAGLLSRDLEARSAYKVKDYARAGADIYRFYALIKKGLYFVLALVVAVGLFNVVSLLILTVMEKRREFAILHTLGLPLRALSLLIMIKGLVTGILSTALGLGLAVALSRLENTYRFIAIKSAIYDISYLPVYLDPWETGAIALVLVALHVLFPIYPAMRVLRIQPARLLRYE